MSVVMGSLSPFELGWSWFNSWQSPCNFDDFLFKDSNIVSFMSDGGCMSVLQLNSLQLVC